MILYLIITQVNFLFFYHIYFLEDNELRFKSVLSDVLLEEKYANNPKKYKLKLKSKSG